MHTLACLNEFASGFSERFRMTQNGSFGWGKGAAATGGLGERRRRSGPAGQEDKQLQQDHQDTASHLVKLREGPHRTHTRSTHAQRIHASCGHASLAGIVRIRVDLGNSRFAAISCDQFT
jgi:hypothetical protein